MSIQCSYMCLHVYLAAMSSPFNIIFTIQSDYTSYSFMSSHINDFIMRSIALHAQECGSSCVRLVCACSKLNGIIIKCEHSTRRNTTFSNQMSNLFHAIFIVTSIIFRYIFSTNYAYSQRNRHNVHSLSHSSSLSDSSLFHSVA